MSQEVDALLEAKFDEYRARFATPSLGTVRRWRRQAWRQADHRHQLAFDLFTEAPGPDPQLPLLPADNHQEKNE